jgi:hypothetical protein
LGKWPMAIGVILCFWREEALLWVKKVFRGSAFS